MLVGRPRSRLGFTLTPVARSVAAAIAGEDPALIGPLMEALEHDLLPRDDDAPPALRRAPALLRRRGRARAARLGGDRGGGRQMTRVTASIDIDAPPERVYDADARPRAPERVGDDPPQASTSATPASRTRATRWTRRCACAAPTSRCTGRSTEADRPDRATWEGRGPARSYARTSYALAGRRRRHPLRVRERVQGAAAACSARRPAGCWWAACPSARRRARCSA